MPKPRPARITDRPTKSQAGSLELVTGKNGQGIMLKRLRYDGAEQRNMARSELARLAIKLEVEVIDAREDPGTEKSQKSGD
jgi:uncharacterized protein (DUF58 family)